MEKRTPLEVHGKDASFQVDGASVLHIKKNGTQAVLPIASIQNVLLRAPGFWGGRNGELVISTADFGGQFYCSLKAPEEFEYAKELQKYITESQANSTIPDAPQPLPPPSPMRSPKRSNSLMLGRLPKKSLRH